MENVAEKQHGLLELLRIRLNPAIEDLGYELYDLEDLQYQGLLSFGSVSIKNREFN